jgi:hypothetical protein
MNTGRFFARTLLLAFALSAISAVADPAKDKAAGAPEIKPPPGWTEDDMKACMMAGTPGKMHEQLARDVGTWQGKHTMWMYPGAEPMKSECTSVVTSIMDGRYNKVEISGDLPGMGPFKGFGINGFDNVSQKFVSTWIDNMSTGIMTGTGELTQSGKTMTWNYTYQCPITKKPATVREVETYTSTNTKTFEIFGAEPKSGKEYKMVSIEFTKK